MPKASKAPTTKKVITIRNTTDMHSITVTRASTPASIRREIAELIGLDDFTILGSNGHVARVSFADVRHKAIYEVAPRKESSSEAKKTGPSKLEDIVSRVQLRLITLIVASSSRIAYIYEHLAVLRHAELFLPNFLRRASGTWPPHPTQHIVKMWGLKDTSEIWPGGLAYAPDDSPEQWSKTFVVEMWKLAKHTRGAHEMAVNWVVEAAVARAQDDKNENYGVKKILTSDVKAALKSRLPRLAHVAGEGLEAGDSMLFAGGLKEEIEDMEQRIDVEDGVTLGQMSL